MSKKKVENENKLSYFIPNHGKPKTSLRIPESHSLYVCPSACGRRHAIRALKNGEKNKISFLYITEADVVSGYYEEIIGDAIAELLAVLKPTPRVFMIYVNCIDDFLGTDEKALLEQLGIRFNSLRFMICHINPVAKDEKISPGMRMHDQQYSFLEYTGKKDNGINMVGNFVPLDEESELFAVLSSWGIHKVRQMFDCKTYKEYQQLANSRMNLVLMPMGELAAQNMARKLDIPYLFNPISYDIDRVVRNYQSMAGLLGQESPNLAVDIVQTQNDIQQTLDYVGDTPIIVDSSSTMQPFALARALCGYGFNIRAVFVLHIKGFDLADRDWLVEYQPQIKIVRSGGYEAIIGFGLENDCLAIGYDSAYTLKARHFVDVRHDESFYGLQGIRKLMRLIREACAIRIDWKNGKPKERRCDGHGSTINLSSALFR